MEPPSHDGPRLGSATAFRPRCSAILAGEASPRRDRPPRRPHARWRMSLAFHIVFAAIGIGMPLLMVIAEWRWLRTGDPSVPRAGEALGEGHRHPVRGRRRVGHGAVVRARAALAGFMRFAGADHRHAVLARGVRVLHRGDLPRHLPLRLGPHAAAARTGWPASWSRVSGRAVRRLRRHRERVDERADRVRHGRTARAGRRRSDRRDAQPGVRSSRRCT